MYCHQNFRIKNRRESILLSSGSVFPPMQAKKSIFSPIILAVGLLSLYLFLYVMIKRRTRYVWNFFCHLLTLQNYFQICFCSIETKWCLKSDFVKKKKRKRERARKLKDNLTFTRIWTEKTRCGSRRRLLTLYLLLLLLLYLLWVDWQITFERSDFIFERELICWLV